MAYTTIDKPNEYFSTNAYTGQNGSRNVTDTNNVNFTPDWVWIKHRQDVSSHTFFDSVRGVGKYLASDSNSAEATETQSLTAFIDGGFSVGTQPNTPRTDESGGTPNHVAWMWKAGGTASSNTDGSITSSVSANTTAGLSIFTWSGTGANGTIGHGLGTAPAFVMVKNRNDIGDWRVWHKTFNGDQYLKISTTDAVATQTTLWNSTVPNSTVISAGTSGDINWTGRTYVGYAFAEKKGYSKFGSYTGNGSTDGTFVYTGFKPAWIMIKNISAGGHNWLMFDNKRDIDNSVAQLLMPNLSNAESTMGTSNPLFDFCSNGFKLRGTGTDGNESGSTHIYMAFAESPFVSSTGIPTPAR